MLWDYFKKSIAIRHSFIALICDPRYKIEVLEFLFDAEGGANSALYKKGKAHFQYVYSDYSRRVILIKNWERQEAIDAQEALDRNRDANSLDVEEEEE